MSLAELKFDTSTWKKVKLGDICTIKTGKLNANAAVEDGIYPFFTCAEEISRIDKYAFDTDAILISGNGSKLGHIHTYNGKFNAYQRTYVLDKFKINKDYLVQYLKANLPTRIKEYVKGGAVPYIVLDCLTDMDVMVPSDDEQIKIAKALTTLDNLIEVRGGQRNMIQAQKSQLMTEIFNKQTPREEWKTVKIGDICEAKAGGDIDKSRVRETPDEIYKYPVYANALTNNGLYGYTDTYKFDGETVTVTGRGDIGHAIARNEAYYPIVRLVVLKPKIKLNIKFLEEAINNINFVIEATGVPQLTAKSIVNYEIKLPPLDVQNKIGKLLEDYDVLIQTKTSNSENIKKSKAQLMNSIFTERESLEWQTYKLEDICNINDRLRKPISAKDRVAGEYPYYGANGVQDYVEGYIFNGNYILVGEDGSVITENGNPIVNLASGKFWANNHVHVIDNKEDKVDFTFLYYAIQNANIKTLVHGNIPKLNQTDFRGIELVLPPLSEQKRIAKLLSEYDELIKTNDKESANLTRAKIQLMNSIFVERESLVWTTVKLGDISTVNSGKGIKKSEYTDNGLYSIIGANGEIGRCDYFNNDKPVLTTGRVGTIGTIQKVNKAWITDNTLIIDIKDPRVTYDFLYYAMDTIDFEKIKTGNAQPLVTAGRLKEVEIQLPNLLEQQRISKVLSDYDNLTSTLDEEIEVLRNTKTQLMNSIFA